MLHGFVGTRGSSRVRAVPIAAEGPWDLPIRGYEVMQVTFAFPLDIVAYIDGGDSCMIRLEGDFHFTGVGQDVCALDASGDRWEI